MVLLKYSMTIFANVRQFTKSASVSSVVQKMKIPEYLLDRTKPADSILSNLKPEELEKLELIKREHKNMSELGLDVPSKLDSAHLLDLLCCTSARVRQKMYDFLWVNEKRRENRIAKKQEKVRPERTSNSIIGDERIVRAIDNRAVRYHYDALQWAEIRCGESAQPLVFDFSFESEMRLVDEKYLASQLSYIVSSNRLMMPYPFHLVLCGLKPSTNQYVFLEDALGLRNEGSYFHKLTELPWTISPKHYLEHYPLSDPNRPVIYLSPNARREFRHGEWNHRAIYVIGAIVDKCVKRPISAAQARLNGVQTMRLPLDCYLKWKDGRTKTLTLNCIHAILATAKRTNGDWERALKENIPKRLYGT